MDLRLELRSRRFSFPFKYGIAYNLVYEEENGRRWALLAACVLLAAHRFSNSALLFLLLLRGINTYYNHY